MFIWNRHAVILRAPEGDAGGGGGGGADDKKFVQADLDRIAAQVRRDTETRFAGFEELKKKAATADELGTELQKAKDALELQNKDAAEQQRILAERARQQSEKETAELKKQVGEITAARDGAATKLRSFQIATTVGAALHAAGVLQSAHSDALASLLSSAEIELGDKGEITNVKYNGLPQKDLAAAATAFLADKAHFKAAKAGGSGTGTPNGGGPLTPERLSALSPEDALAEGYRTAPSKSNGADRWDQQ
jgi:archaellum component FlaC